MSLSIRGGVRFSVGSVSFDLEKLGNTPANVEAASVTFEVPQTTVGARRRGPLALTHSNKRVQRTIEVSDALSGRMKRTQDQIIQRGGMPRPDVSPTRRRQSRLRAARAKAKN
jgi:hypothetical protein